MSKELTQDELGAVGESLFAHLCGLAAFVCNKSDRDRTGWDFVVELPMSEPGPGLSLDQRAPTAAAIQIKATARSGPVSARLSAIERLAKDPRPAFIVVFRLRPDGQPIAGYVIHLLGPVLARILRRLREAQAKSALAINKATVSFDHHRIGTRFDPTPEGLRSAVEAACGTNPGAYLTEKQRQLDELGYEGGGLQAEATFWVDGPDHLNNILMGLEPVRPQHFRAYDTRFGISIPYTGPAFDELEELLLQPPTLGGCQVSVRGPALSTPAVFEAKMFAGPPVEVENAIWLMVKHDDFTLTFRRRELSFETSGAFDAKPRTLAAWLPLMRALRYLAEGTGVMRLSPGFDSSIQLDMPFVDNLTGPHLNNLPALVDILEGWSRLIELAGVTSTEPFLITDIYAARTAHLAVDIMVRGGAQARFAFEATDLAEPEGDIEALYFNTSWLGDAPLSYAAKVTLSRRRDKPSEFISKAFAPIDIRPAVSVDLQDYGEEIAQQHGIRVLMNPANITEVEFKADA